MQSTPHKILRRNASIDSLRGLALILMVAGHVIGSAPERGMQVSDDSSWRLFYWLLEDVRMPLFTVLSGMVYAHRPLLTGSLGTFSKGKARRLLIPMAIVGTAYFLLQLVVPGTNSKPHLSDYWRIFLFGYEHLWFVQAVFLIFITVGVLDRLGALSTPRRWTISTIGGCLLYLFVQAPGGLNFFSWVQACRLLPFFLLGYGLHRYSRVLLTRPIVAVVAIGFVGMVALKVLPLMGAAQTTPEIVSLGLGATTVVLLVTLKKYLTWGPLAWLGQFSFGVYLLHVFGTASTRIILGQLGIDGDLTVFFSCIVVGILAPIILELLVGRYPLFSWGVLGQKPRRAELTSEQAQAQAKGRVI